MCFDFLVELRFELGGLSGGMEDTVGRLELLATFGPRLHSVVLACLQEVFHLVHLEGDELHGALAEARVQQVVAQAEVQKLALPEGLACELALIDLQSGFLCGID